MEQQMELQMEQQMELVQIKQHPQSMDTFY